MNIPLLLGGVLAIAAAAVHGAGGQLLVVRELVRAPLPATRFGGPAMTKAMLYATWHITTLAFLVVGAGMVVSASALERDAAEAVAILSAAAFTGFAAVATGFGAVNQPLRALLRHPGPIVLTAAAALAWWGAMSS